MAVGLENSRSFEAAKSSAAGPSSAASFAGVAREAWGDVETEAGVALAVGTRPSGVDTGVSARLAAAATSPGSRRGARRRNQAFRSGHRRERRARRRSDVSRQRRGRADDVVVRQDGCGDDVVVRDLLRELLRRRGRRGERCLDLPARLRAQSAPGGEDRLEVGGDRLAGSERYGFGDGRAERVGARMTILADSPPAPCSPRR